MSRFQLSQRSLARLIAVHPARVEIVKLAIQRTAVDFTVVEGVRTLAQQREPMASATLSTWRRWCGARSLGTTGSPSSILPG
ncbi:hypothetical protein G6F55_014523 [Rhizopus delemar]|nr:hypothetical protein G6F55_014523 [Rhizopus delemar]